MTSAPREHKAEAPQRVRCAAITISDTRDKESDKSGRIIQDFIVEAGHEVVLYDIVKDDMGEIRAVLEKAKSVASIVVLSGGTGLTRRDSTYEVVSELLTKPLPGFGELFRMLSYEEIGAAAMMSRATAGAWDDCFVFALPGSSGAVRLAMKTLIVPELGHIVQQLSK